MRAWWIGVTKQLVPRVVRGMHAVSGTPRRSSRERDEATDPALLRRAFVDLAGGDEAALDRIYDALAERVYAVACWRTGSRDEAADVVQETFVRLAERRQRLAEVEDPRAWLLTVAHRIATDRYRRRGRQQTESLDDQPQLEATTIDPDHRLDAARATRALAALPPLQRTAIVLHQFEGCTFAEIGRITRASTFTAASRYRLGLQKLRRLLGDRT